MKIGELAQRTGTLVETVRFYERQALLPEPSRTAGNYRIYEEHHVQRLGFIRHCRTLDMTLDEIRVLLRFIDAPNKNCGEVNTLLDTHIDHVADRIRELKALERDLKDLRRLCAKDEAAKDCRILCKLTQVAAQQSRKEPQARGAHIAGSHGSPRRPR